MASPKPETEQDSKFRLFFFCTENTDLVGALNLNCSKVQVPEDQWKALESHICQPLIK